MLCFLSHPFLACQGIIAQLNLPDTDREEHPSNQELTSKRRSRRRESLREGKEDDLKNWREKGKNKEFLLDPELNESPGRQGQVSLMVEKDQVRPVLGGSSDSSGDLSPAS